jgi:hypothetical protein
MLVFPQLVTGATAQYPIRRRRSERAILNLSQDGSVIALWDESASQVKWDLRFAGLTDLEVSNFTSFYELCEGSLQSFLFLDPAANLFAYSEDFTQPAWQRNTLLSITAGIEDPYGTTRASQLTNNSLGALSITQTLQIPGFTACALSVYASSSASVPLTLTRSDGSNVESILLQTTPAWTRFSLNTAFASSISTSCDFSLELPAGAAIDIFGFQVEPQPMPGTYVMTSAYTGIYPNTRFDANPITVTATAPGESSLSVSLLSPSAQ